jgi:hypothetical protein
MADTTSTEDPFEDFDVDSGSEKEFLIANLRNDAPKDAVEQFWRAGNLPATLSSSIQQWDITMDQKDVDETVRTARVSDTDFGDQDWREFKFLQSATTAEIDARIYELIVTEQDENGEIPLPSLEYPAPHLVLQKRVEEFARSHMFTVNKHVKPTTLQRREFTRDIYDYARAIGMGRHQADIEVLRARATYRHDRGLAGGLMLDESDDESTLGLEINDAAEYIASIKNGMKRGPLDPAGAWENIKRLQARSVHSDSSSRKRKRAMVDTPTANRAVGFKASKKHKRRRLEQLHSTGVNENPAKLAEMPSVTMSKKERKRAKRRRRSTLNKAEGNMDVKSEVLLPANRISKSALMTQFSTKHSGETGGETKRNETAVAKLEGPIGAKPMGKLKVESFTASKQGVHNDVGGESWDLRQKKKKKRKRKTADGWNNKADPLDAKTEAKPDDSNINIDSFQHREDSRKTAKHEKEGIKKDTADDNGSAKPTTELISTNSNKKMQGRRNRGTKKKAVTAPPKASPFAETESEKVHHS